jgi:hypothetical protein
MGTKRMLRQLVATKIALEATNTDWTSTDNPAEGEVLGETLRTHVNRAKARWLKRVMYETSASSTGKCFAYSVADHLNCVTLDCWAGTPRLVLLLGCKCTKTPQRAARELQRLGVLTIKHCGPGRYRYAPTFLAIDSDKIVRARGQTCPPTRDRNVDESLLSILPKSSSSTAVASKGSNGTPCAVSGYDRRQRGIIEISLASRLGPDGINILSRLAAIDDAIIDRMCRAHAAGMIGEPELAAARLAAEQS